MIKLLPRKDPKPFAFKKIISSPICAFFASLTAALILWECVSRSGLYPPHLLPPPSVVARALRGMALSGELWLDIKSSGVRWLCGLFIGNLAGISLGVLTGTIPSLKNSVGQILNLLRTLPFIVLIPLSILWFGLGETAKILIVAWGALFPVWLNVEVGVGNVEREYVRAAQCLGAEHFRLYWEVHLHRCLPHLVAGVRVSIATATFALAAAEMAGAFDGLAFRVFYSHEMFQTDKMMAGIVTLAALGFALDRGFVWASGRLLPWWEESRS